MAIAVLTSVNAGRVRDPVRCYLCTECNGLNQYDVHCDSGTCINASLVVDGLLIVLYINIIL